MVEAEVTLIILLSWKENEGNELDSSESLKNLFIGLVKEGQKQGFLNSEFSDEAISVYFTIIMEGIFSNLRLNETVYKNFPDVQTIAEDSTAWPMVSRPTYEDGLGFGAKWDMGWMHDTLTYMKYDPLYRKYHQNNLTFRTLYAFAENFVLPLSHDEVVHGNGSLINKMPGNNWQKFGNLRALFGYMFTILGKKLLFMGGELGQWQERSPGSLELTLPPLAILILMNESESHV